MIQHALGCTKQIHLFVLFSAIRVGFGVTEYTADEEQLKGVLTFDIGNPIIVDTHFFVLCMTYEEYDNEYPELNKTYPGLAHFPLNDQYDQAERKCVAKR